MQMNQKLKKEREIENYSENIHTFNKNNKSQSDTALVIDFLQEMARKTTDSNLKYDLSKCLEIIQGKENLEMTDLKDTLKLVLEENERLEKKNIELMCDIQHLGGEIKD
ncbi:hypothetical protein M153_1922600078 [Pseudoloma neurophilia]|uniref:Uncharacterized protein n=1 Tax=Pseudoloma neurophilia TaxID=146866 RepID=A0A0R0LXZ5_9MICR|nr:hypothetical protein M153_1922600078 [Pseudoloma neurophilia]